MNTSITSILNTLLDKQNYDKYQGNNVTHDEYRKNYMLYYYGNQYMVECNESFIIIPYDKYSNVIRSRYQYDIKQMYDTLYFVIIPINNVLFKFTNNGQVIFHIVNKDMIYCCHELLH